MRGALHTTCMQVEQRTDGTRHRAMFLREMLVDEEFPARNAHGDEQDIGMKFLQLRQNTVEIGGLEESRLKSHDIHGAVSAA